MPCSLRLYRGCRLCYTSPTNCPLQKITTQLWREREALAIKWVIMEVRYNLSCHFILVTDHTPVQWIAMAKATNTCVTCWFLSCQDVSFQVQHRGRTQHGNTNGLSRCYSLWTEPVRMVGLELGTHATAVQENHCPSSASHLTPLLLWC